MPSPFPGMDPYLEHPDFWPGFHTKYLVALAAQIGPRLPDGLYAEVEQYIRLESDIDDSDEEPITYRPDVLVASKVKKKVKTLSAIYEPGLALNLPKPKKTSTKRFIAISKLRTREVVTVVELLSHSDKSGSTNGKQYHLKRETYLANGISFVEIDLIRSGHRMVKPQQNIPDADYYFLVSPAFEFPVAEVWATTVRDALPSLPIPTGKSLPPVVVDQRVAMDRVYEEAAYNRQLDYTQPPIPALRSGDAEWAEALIKKHSQRKTP
ncbi:MAG: DUF4058 family protein [Fimbriiglobus sp.]